MATPAAPRKRPSSNARSDTGAAITSSCNCAWRSRITGWANTQAQANSRKKASPEVIM
ncbi:hypothetical protein D3C81_872680 [compost metagenome]